MQSLVIAPLECRFEANHTVISADITVQDRKFNIFFDIAGCPVVPSDDAFLAATLLPAMKLGLPIVMPGPISPRLKENVGAIQSILRVWRHDKYHDRYGQFSEVMVHPQSTSPPPAVPATGVASFFSCGVDSFYTLLKHLDEIDYLVYIRGFELPFDWEPKDTALADKIAAAVRSVAEAYGKSVIEVTTNLRQMADQYVSEQLFHGSFLAAVAYLLTSRVSKIYIPATHDYTQLFPWGSHPLLDPLWTTEAVAIIHDGADALRLEKTARIATDPVALRHLRVCWMGEYNCGACNKCMRTIIGLQTLGALDRCSTFERGPFTPAEVARIALSDVENSCYFEEIWEYLTRSGTDAELMHALHDALTQKYYRGFGRLRRGDLRGRIIRRVQSGIRGALARGAGA